ncbi:MAG: 1-deoxy-D-xylulose-5-phosphate synthase [Lachnospiraceae bacterium]|nr:1-deoxy-D-xylulose-5-phosphate synthase [Lachnospiraceae bacterium]
MAGILDRINQPNDIKEVSPAQYNRLAKEIRHFLLHRVSEHGGHLASNLGAVELTMALHLFLDFPKDKLIWDVGHQAYVHKILTGRREGFHTLREYQGMSGFPKRKESECDAFDTGHSSTSLSIANGLVTARQLSGGDEKIVAVIGDGALSGGMAMEALNNVGKLHSNLIIVLNDNNMSISENVGGMANYLAKIRSNTAYTGFKDGLEDVLSKFPIGETIAKKLKQSKNSLKHLFIGGMYFEDLGITYIGPIDGHDIEQITRALETASKMPKAVLVHVVTKKGKGYGPAEQDPGRFHGIEPFALKTGEILRPSEGVSYTKMFSDTMLELGEQNKKIVGITAAMPTGTGLTEFAKKYPERFFDVGIAEEHAVTFAAGMAAGGYHPVVAVYSTFLQRAYDQILHDVCIGNLPVTFAVDRAGIVGKDGETHQGVFDLSYLAHIPNLTVMAPKSTVELRDMLHFAASCNYPVAVRYPRGTSEETDGLPVTEIMQGKAELLEDAGVHMAGKSVAFVAVGNTVSLAYKLKARLEAEGISVSIANARFVAPMDEECILSLAKRHDVLVTLEENVARGGFGERVSALLMEQNTEVRHVPGALSNCFIEHGGQQTLRDLYGLNEDNLYVRIREVL